MLCVENEKDGLPGGQQMPAGLNPPSVAEGPPARSLKAEVNLLRLPLFALHTKGLSTLEGIECRGRVQRDGATHEYFLRISRNTGSFYPGPLSRKVHFALLSIATERGLPLKNPITWTWRDLCRRMNNAYGGQKTLKEIKTAIRSTHGIVIRSQYALYSRSDGQPLPLHERGHHLYSDYAFSNEPRSDGTVADANAVWFADWYLDNLNALYSAPIDYDLWRSLEARSPTASRLYEILLLNLYSGAPVFRINYANLAKLLPVRSERYLSDARKQLGPAISLLEQANVVSTARWEENTEGTIQLHFARGPLLRSGRKPNSQGSPALIEETLGSVRIQELRNSRPVENQVVRQFYQLWSGDTFTKPSPKELTLARELIGRYGRTKLHALLPLVVKRLKDQWPDAKTFNAAARYVPEVNDEYERKQAVVQQEKQRHLQEQTEEEKQQNTRSEQRRLIAQWWPAWEALAEEDRERIEATVRGRWPHVARLPKMFERYCVLELIRSRGETVPV
jgi:hypothetical protein